MVLVFFGLIAIISLLHTLLVMVLYDGAVFAGILIILLAAWTRVHQARQKGWVERRLKFDEAPEPAVYSLNLLK
jgi:membrane protein implicated in regulation of membrane protease activity